MTQAEYDQLIKSVSGAYTGAKNASKKDILEFSKEMKDHWKSIEKAAAPLKKAATKQVKKVAKKVPKASTPRKTKSPTKGGDVVKVNSVKDKSLRTKMLKWFK